MKFFIRDLIVICVALSAACGSAAEPVASKKDEGPIALYEWLPSDCPTMMFVLPPNGRLEEKEPENSLILMPYYVLSGAGTDLPANPLKPRKIKAIAAAAEGFKMVKHGPVGISICRGCVIVVFEDDLEQSGKDYMNELEKAGGKRLSIENQVVVKSSSRPNDESAAADFTSHPNGSTFIFSNDVNMMKHCLKRMKEKSGPNESKRKPEPWFYPYVDPKASFTALIVHKEEKVDTVRQVITWKNASPSIVEIAWLAEQNADRAFPADYPEEIRKAWKLPEPVGLMPTITKVDKGNVWLRLELSTKEKWVSGMMLIRTYLGFGTTF